MNAGIIICSRMDSSRIRNKPLQNIAGKPLLIRLIERLSLLNISIVVAIPSEENYEFASLMREVKETTNCYLFHGVKGSPLHRTLAAAEYFKFDAVVRVTHDKIFVDIDLIEDCLNQLDEHCVEYIYSSHLNDGTGFEVFTTDLLRRACKAHPNPVEHISYALKAVNPTKLDFKPHPDHRNLRSDVRLLIDFEEDLDFIRSIYAYAREQDRDDLSLYEALRVVEENPWLKKINRQPEVTVYTCAYNEQEFIPWCISSVVSQTIFPEIEYIIIDDASTDQTYEKLVNSPYFYNYKLIRNEKNIGLSSSSNVALNMARGKYIMRLDADDALIFPYTIEKMLAKAKQENFDALYPTFADDRTKTFRDGASNHHVGGCLFLTRTIRNIQFTEGLRGWEGLDLFERAKDQIKIGYYNELPAFFYRDKPNSLSKQNPEYREMIRKSIFGIPDCNGVPI